MSEEDHGTVLVIDDDDAVRRALARSIERAGFKTNAAASGREALAIFEEHRGAIDCALLDIRMPEMSGTEVLLALNRRYPMVPVIMVTATNDIETAIDCMRNGAFHYLVKPAERGVVVETIHKAIAYREIQLSNERLRAQNDRYQHELEQMVSDRTAKLRETLARLRRNTIETVEVLAETIDAKDPYTRGHCGRVRDIAKRIAVEIGVDAGTLQRLEYGALLHDIGKIGVPEAILRKDGPLNDDEWTALKQHPVVGETILKPLKFFQPVLTIVRNHHERFDGAGYPDGLAGDEIDPAARIVAVADAFDAMTSTRPYRTALTTAEAISRIVAGTGSQFDPELSEAFVTRRLYDSGSENGSRYATPS